MKKLLFCFTFTFVFSFFVFSSSAESITKVIQLNSDTVTKEDFSNHSSSSSITIEDAVTLSVLSTSVNPQSFVAFDLSKFDLANISDIVINDLFIDYINEGTNLQFNFGFVLNDHLYYKYASKWGSAFPQTENSFSILGTYYDQTDRTEFSAAEPFELTSSDIPQIQCLVFHLSGHAITLNSLTLVGDPVTTSSVVPGQTVSTVSVDKLIDDGFSIFNVLNSDFITYIFVIVGVFILIDIGLIFFMKVTK